MCSSDLLGGFGGPFGPDLYAPLVLAIAFRAPAEMRTAVFALLGLVRDLISAGRFGGFAFSYALCSVPISSFARYMVPDSVVVRLLFLFIFCSLSSVTYTVAADTAWPFLELPGVMLQRLGAAGGNALLGSFLWPFYEMLLPPRPGEGSLIARY